MSDNEQKERIGISIDSVTLTKVDAQLKKSGVKSRSEYINIAVDAYLDFLNNETIRNVVAPMFETVVSAKIEDSENDKHSQRKSARHNIDNHFVFSSTLRSRAAPRPYPMVPSPPDVRNVLGFVYL